MIPSGTFAEMLKVAQSGDYLFLWDKNPVAEIIENVTDGPSHVITLAKFPEFSEFVEMEAVFPEGCRILPLSHYANNPCRMVLCRRKRATPQDIALAVGRGLQVMGRRYEVHEEIEIALALYLPKRIAPHITSTENDLFCSGMLADEYHTGSVPFTPSKTGGNITPQEALDDPLTEIVFQVN